MDTKPQEKFVEAILDKDTKSSLRYFESNPQEIKLAIQYILEQLIEIESTENPDISKYLEFINDLLEEFEHPIAIRLEQASAPSILDVAYERGYSNEVAKIVFKTIRLFEFDKDGKLLPLFYAYYVSLFSSNIDFDAGAQKTPFIAEYEKIQDTISKIQRSQELNDSDASKLQADIQARLQFGFLQDQNISEFESELLLEECYKISSLCNEFDVLNRKVVSTDGKQHQSTNDEEEAKKVNVVESKPHLKTSFYKFEILSADEGIDVEYKHYFFPLTSEYVVRIISKTICSMLNRRGGRIFIGVRDVDRRVTGMKMLAKERDELKLQVQNMIKYFEPSIRNADLVNVAFIPIKDYHTKQTIPGLFVTKIIVKQGDTDKLYSVDKKEVKCYMRNDGESVQLKTAEVFEMFAKRIRNPEKPIDPSQFNDPEPDKIIDVFFEKKPQNDHPKPFKKEHSHNSQKNNMPSPKLRPQGKTIGVMVQGMFQNITRQQFENLVGKGRDPNVVSCLLLDDRENRGNRRGYVNFFKTEFAEHFAKQLNGVEINGSRISAFVLSKPKNTFAKK